MAFSIEEYDRVEDKLKRCHKCLQEGGLEPWEVAEVNEEIKEFKDQLEELLWERA